MSIPLEDIPEVVPSLKEVKDIVSTEWVKYCLARGIVTAPSLRATSWDGDTNNSPSHKRSSAIDIVTDSWSTRGYLFGFGVWLATRFVSKDLNVIFYKRSPQPHLHVALWSGENGKPEASIGFSLDGVSSYKYFHPDYADEAEEICELIDEFSKTYTDNEVDVDMAFILKLLLGKLGFLDKIMIFLKKYWLFIVIPLVIAIPVFFFLRKKDG